MLSVYFPTQKRSKMRVTMSSRAVRPVSSPSASSAPSASVSTTSGVSPAVSASCAARTLSSARRMASACRALVSSVPPAGTPAGKQSPIVSINASSPPGITELKETRCSGAGAPSGSLQTAVFTAGFRSSLLMARIQCGARAASARMSGSTVSGVWLPSATTITRSALSTARRERSTPSRSTASSVSRMPAVSMSRSSTPPTTAFSSTVSRVVPGMSVTMARS